jgi:hypothetical protein
VLYHPLASLQAGLWLAVFYFGSFMSNVLGKELVGDKHVSSAMLTLLQLSTAVISDCKP